MKHALAALIFLLPGIACAEETLAQRCTSDAASSYRGEGDRKFYVFDVENTCSFRLRCELNIAIFNSFGMKLDHKILTIEPGAHGSLILHVQAFGGMNSHQHTCIQN